MGNAPNESKEKGLPADQRESLRLLAEKIRVEDPAAANSLEASTDKIDALRRLRGLSNDVTSGRLKAIQKTEIDTIHDKIEKPALMTTRPVEELAQAALDKAREMDPMAKQIAIGTGVVGGGILGYLGLRKFFSGAYKMGVKAKDATLDFGEMALKKTGSFLSWLLKTAAVAGVGALTFLGVQKYFEKKESDPNTKSA